MTMSICNDAFRTNEISTICCRLMAPEGPTGSPREPPDTPWIFTCTTKAKGNDKISGNVWKDKQQITKNITMSTFDYAFKTHEILTTRCRLKAPTSLFQTLGLAISQGTCDMFQKSIKKIKTKVLHHKGFLVQLYLLKTANINNLKPSRGPRGSPRPPLDFQMHYRSQGKRLVFKKL